MASLYTKNGVPLQVAGSDVYNRDGQHFGYISGDRVHGLDGHYRGTIVGDRLIYRSTDSAMLGSVHGRTAGIGGSGMASAAGTGDWGDEPDINP